MDAVASDGSLDNRYFFDSVPRLLDRNFCEVTGVDDRDRGCCNKSALDALPLLL